MARIEEEDARLCDEEDVSESDEMGKAADNRSRKAAKPDCVVSLTPACGIASTCESPLRVLLRSDEATDAPVVVLRFELLAAWVMRDFREEDAVAEVLFPFAAFLSSSDCRALSSSSSACSRSYAACTTSSSSRSSCGNRGIQPGQLNCNE